MHSNEFNLKKHFIKTFVIGLFAVILPILLIALQSESQLPSKIKSEDQAYREYMLKMTRQLGTTCSACHNPNNFASAEKIEFKKSKEHIHITQALIDAGFDGQNGRPLADCYLCHRGKMKPDFREPFDPMTMKKLPETK